MTPCPRTSSHLVPANLDGVWIDKLCLGVDVLDPLVPESHPITPVEGADVGLDGLHQRSPVVAHLR